MIFFSVLHILTSHTALPFCIFTTLKSILKFVSIAFLPPHAWFGVAPQNMCVVFSLLTIFTTFSFIYFISFCFCCISTSPFSSLTVLSFMKPSATLSMLLLCSLLWTYIVDLQFVRFVVGSHIVVSQIFLVASWDQKKIAFVFNDCFFGKSYNGKHMMLKWLWKLTYDWCRIKTHLRSPWRRVHVEFLSFPQMYSYGTRGLIIANMSSTLKSILNRMNPVVTLISYNCVPF